MCADILRKRGYVIGQLRGMNAAANLGAANPYNIGNRHIIGMPGLDASFRLELVENLRLCPGREHLVERALAITRLHIHRSRRIDQH